MKNSLSGDHSFRFTRAITRRPASSVIDGIRHCPGPDPDAALFKKQHASYVDVLRRAGAQVTQLPKLESFPDSVFVEDITICLTDTAIVLRPGAASRFGEAELMRPILEKYFLQVINLPGDGYVDGGDVLLSNSHAFIGLSQRTNQAGFDALASILGEFGYLPVKVETPPNVLHFKTECGLLDSETVFATANLAAIDCFKGYRVIKVPEGEEKAANIVRFNDVVLISAGYPKSTKLLLDNGFNPVPIDTSEPAKIDGGLSCMSLRF